jgi:hypothetical protein
VLDLTLATRFEPSSNLKGATVGGSWRFLLPSLELDTVVVLGRATPATLRALRQTARSVVVGADGVEPGTADLLVADSSGMIAGASGLLRPNGIAFVDARDRDLPDARLYWLAPPSGEVEGAAPLTDHDAVLFLKAHARADSGVRRTPAERVRRWLRRNRSRRPGTRIGTLSGAASGPPRYLQTLAADVGLDIAGWRFALAAPGRYASKKVLVFLFDGPSGPPAAVVKLTRDPAHNARLENEGRSLRLLEQRGFGEGTLPRTLFDGHHAGLAVVGESALDGVPFRTRASGRADCPWLAKAVGWVTSLGEATVDHDAATPEEAAAALDTLLTQWADVYQPSESHHAFLADQVAAVARSNAPFPAVFQHGDPGTWNALALTDGRVGFLDWEAAEPVGMPLWDLFYLLRSYSVSAGRRAPAAASFLDDALVGVATDAISRHVAAIGLRPELVGPLLYTSLLHRSLKEATRLPPERIGDGPFARLLGQCIDRREDERLRRLTLAAPGDGRRTTSEGGR